MNAAFPGCCRLKPTFRARSERRLQPAAAACVRVDATARELPVTAAVAPASKTAVASPSKTAVASPSETTVAAAMETTVVATVISPVVAATIPATAPSAAKHHHRTAVTIIVRIVGGIGWVAVIITVGGAIRNGVNRRGRSRLRRRLIVVVHRRRRLGL